MSELFHSNDVSVVMDSSVIFDLHVLGCLEVIFKIFQVVGIPRVLYNDEIDPIVCEVIDADRCKIMDIKNKSGMDLYQTLVNDLKYRSLSRCDRFAIAIAKESMYFCTSNDKVIRRVCDEFGVRCTGVLGVLGRSMAHEGDLSR